ncbi:hypothetical protein [Thiofaba sp. EF100]|uniref:hypothetical protein n=1 Tax=Thiofaba sp. EF100 TaxID=3121274 RepID=UPI00322149E5
MDMITHPDTELMVATLTRCGRRWMVMLWDGQGWFRATQWHKTKREALDRMQAHCASLGVPCRGAS